MEKFHDGKNIARITHFQAGIPRDPNAHYTIYDITMTNKSMRQISFRYAVPEGRDPHAIIKDLHFFYKMNPKPWILVGLQYNNTLRQFQIISLEEIKEKTQEEVDQDSLDERGGRIKLQ